MDLMQELISTRSLLSRFVLKVYDKMETDHRTEQSVRVRAEKMKFAVWISFIRSFLLP